MIFINDKHKTMGWGIFKKIANAVKKAVKWTGNHIIKPVINTAKKVINSDSIVIGIPYGVEQNSGGIFTPSPTNPVLIGFRKKIEYHNYFGTGFPSFLNARFLRRHLNSSFSKSSC